MAGTKKSAQQREKQIQTVVRFLRSGATHQAAAEAAGISQRTLFRWLEDPALKNRLKALEEQHKTIVETDSLVLSVVEVREQVSQILAYRESQSNLSRDLSAIVARLIKILSEATMRLEEDCSEVTVRTLPALLRESVNATQKLSEIWSRSIGFDDLATIVRSQNEEN